MLIGNDPNPEYQCTISFYNKLISYVCVVSCNHIILINTKKIVSNFRNIKLIKNLIAIETSINNQNCIAILKNKG